MKRTLSIVLCLFAVLALSSCGSGGGGGGASSGSGFGAFEDQVESFMIEFDKSEEWQAWMNANKSRYWITFNTSSTKPETLTISYRYDSAPIAYLPAWTDEQEHMDVFATFAQGAFVGYNFNFVFGGNTNSSYANVITGIPTNLSYSYGKDVYLYYETIFNHEFGHTMGLPHHYDSSATTGDGQHMPPGESKCIMDRNSKLFCSACRTALGVPLDVTDTTELDAAMADIASRYPY